jgi:hypothetical protein
MSKKICQQFACSKMMLPEHRTSLQKQGSAAEWAENHPSIILDEQLQEELQRTMECALEKSLEIKLTILNSSGYHTYRGVPLRLDSTSGTVYIESGATRPQAIRAAEIIRLELI